MLLGAYFLGQHNAVGLGIFFPFCDICILSPPFIPFGSALQSHTVHFYSSADVT